MTRPNLDADWPRLCGEVIPGVVAIIVAIVFHAAAAISARCAVVADIAAYFSQVAVTLFDLQSINIFHTIIIIITTTTTTTTTIITVAAGVVRAVVGYHCGILCPPVSIEGNIGQVTRKV